MKNIYKILIAFISVLAISCNADDVEDRPIIEAITTPEITAPESGRQYILVEENGNNDADRFVWSAAQYSDNVVVSYTLLMDIAGGDFTAPQTLATTSNITQAAVTVKNLNQAAIELGAEPGTLAQFDIKILASVSGGVPMMSETPITISINTYSGLIAYPFTDWYLIGAAVEGGWDNNADTKHQPMFRDGVNADQYKFVGYFNAGNFKLISQKGSWESQLGRSGEGTIEMNGNAGEFTIATAGYYTFQFNTTQLTYTLVAYDASAATTFNTVGIIGSSTAGAWDTSTAMEQSDFDSHAWTLGTTALNDGEAKFRANDAWDVSWGGKTVFSGGGTGDNIPVTKSKYLIYFNDLDGSYLMIPNQE